VFTTSTTQAGRSPLFVARTEILRGPQGTLYGRNAIGGAYNVISKRPSRDFSGEARLSFANYDRQRFDGTVSIPINDNWRTKFGISRLNQGEGFAHNLVPGMPDENGPRDETYYEAQLEGEFGKTDVWFYFGKNVWRNSASPGGSTGGSFAPPDTTPGKGTFPSATYCFTGALNCDFGGVIRGNTVLQTGDVRAFQRDTAYNNRLRDSNAVTLQLTHHFDNFDVKYVGGFNRYDYSYKSDIDGTAVKSYQVPLNTTGACAKTKGCTPATVYFGNTSTYQEDEEFYSHELTLSSTWDSPLQYIAGVYFYHEKFAYPQDGYTNQPQLANPILTTGAPAAPNPDKKYFHTNNFASVVSKAIYGQVDYKLTDTIKLTGGLRYTQDDKKTTEEGRFISYGSLAPYTLADYGSLAPALDITASAIGTASAAQLAAQGGRQQGVLGPAVIDPVTGMARRNLRGGSNAVTGTAGVEWAPDRKTLAYAKYSRGYKAFGLNTAVGGAFSPFPYSKPEQMDAFEVGLKKDWTRRFQTNVSGFYDLYYDAQVPLSVQQGDIPSFSIFYNVPRSVIQGVELETTWQPTDRLNVLFTYAYLDSHVSKACCLSDPQDPTAKQPGAKPAGASTQGAKDSITGDPTSGQDLAGNALPFTPHNKVALNVNYTYPVGSYGDLIGSVSYLWRDEQYSSFFNRWYNKTKARDQIDLRLTFKDAKNRFNIVGYARNLTNSNDFESMSGSRDSLGRVYQSYSLVDPRTFGVELQVRF
jgi:iron complex outermembrane receptor protein